MTRAQIQQELVELDRQINEESAKNRVPSLNMKHRSFPWGNWIGAIFFIAAGVMGPQYVQAMAPWSLYVIGFGALVGLSALLRTVLFVVKGRKRNDKNYAAATEKIRQLQARRQELQRQLKES